MEIVSVEQIPDVNDIIDVPTDDLMAVYKLCQKMEKACDDANGIGLSAVQVKIPWKLFIIKENSEFRHFINCEYFPIDEEKFQLVEGCLSLRTKGGFRYFELNRYKKIRVVGKMLDLSKERPELLNVDRVENGFYSAVFQHEIDHQLGITIDQIGQEVNLY